MAKPLRSEDSRPIDVQFRDFGVLNTGASSKSATITSITVNVVLAALVIVLGAVVKNKLPTVNKLDSVTFAKEPPPPPKPIKMPPPPKLPPPPKVEPPKIDPPKLPPIPKPVNLPPEIKPVAIPTPKVNLTPPAPKKIDPPPAPPQPKAVSLAAKPASIANNDAHPSAVSLGHPDNPLKTSAGPAVSPVNMRAGFSGMPPGNTGNGANSAKTVSGFGSPQGTNLNGHDRGPVPVAGLAHGTVGGTGTGVSGPRQVNIGVTQAPSALTHPPTVTTAAAGTPPRLTFKPTPAYTEEARSMHLEGNVTLRIRVTAEGAVQVLGVVHGLGHGLDQSAQQAASGMHFTPAKDSTGHFIDWEGPVTVLFQLS